MKTFVANYGLHRLVLLLTLIVLAPAAARAQQALEVPGNQQVQPPLHYRPRPATRSTPAPSNQIQTLPSIATPAATPVPAQTESEITPPPAYRPEPVLPRPQPVLPAVFRGCWQGRVSSLDRIDRLPGGARIGPWTPKTYRLCYKRIGQGPFELTFSDAGVAHNRKITNSAGEMQLVSTDGRSYATMRAFLHFDEYHTHTSDFGSSTFPVDETTKLQCDIKPDGMHVWGTVYGEHDGSPWFRAWWHTVFTHEPG